MMKRNSVVLVDKNDKALGQMEKLAAHQQGFLHRAFSVFVWNAQGQLLLQQRSAQKYHGAGLWSNACCSHPQWGEDVRRGAMERLQYEMGLSCELEFLGTFIYNIKVENGLTEHEYDHIFVGYSDAQPVIHPDEAQDFKWMDLDRIKEDVNKNPQKYTSWLRLVLSLNLLQIKK